MPPALAGGYMIVAQKGFSQIAILAKAFSNLILNPPAKAGGNSSLKSILKLETNKN
ncbi:MAG: hypothetical protein J7574_08940 [Flavobacterium sp.]|nr:hypothetical protein [Flavobacterium sp.]